MSNSLDRRSLLKSLTTMAASPLLLGNFGCAVDRLLRPELDETAISPFTLVGAGDQHCTLSLGARGRTASQVQKVLDADRSALAFAIGDLTHSGHEIEYQTYYHNTWGKFKDRTVFGIGNHDTMYALPRGAAYYAYTAAPKYYARTLGNSWRVYMLTCMNATEGGVSFTEQLAWLKADLAEHAATHHILAMVHYPMFASVCEHHLKDMTSKPRVGPMWDALQGAGMRVCGQRSCPPPGRTNQFSGLNTSGVATCGVTTANRAYCWGSDGNFQVGDGNSTQEQYTTPNAVTGGLQFRAITTGTIHTCAITTDNAAYCWGNNFPRASLASARSTVAPVSPPRVRLSRLSLHSSPQGGYYLSFLTVPFFQNGRLTTSAGIRSPRHSTSNFVPTLAAAAGR